MGFTNELTDVASSEKITGVSVYPNPTNNQLTISTGDEKLDDIEIYNVLGQLVKEFNPQGASKFNANIHNLSSGIYFVKIFTKNWNQKGQQQQKIIKLIIR